MDNDQAVEILGKTVKVIEQLYMCEKLLELTKELRETPEITNGVPFVTSQQPNVTISAFIYFISQLRDHNYHKVKVYFREIRDEFPRNNSYTAQRFGNYILRTNNSEVITIVDTINIVDKTYKIIRDPRNEKFAVDIFD